MVYKFTANFQIFATFHRSLLEMRSVVGTR